MTAPQERAAPDRETACVAALACLPDMTPRRLALVLRGRAPDDAWDRVARGWVPPSLRPNEGPAELARAWREHAAAHPPEAVAERLVRAGIAAVRPAGLGLDERLAGLDPPVSILFAVGSSGALDHPCVALVGTRRASALGREIARSLGGDLAAAGVAVISGLALGIDAAAHTGVVARPGGAPPIAVVGTGVDVPYPQTNARLWAAVAERGLVLSEHPPGIRALPHHFPQRNRIVAALAAVVVVVESHRAGGALITAGLAAELGRTVGAVPGSLRNPAAEGANLLLRDGAVPILDAVDVLVAAGWHARAPAGPSAGDPGADPWATSDPAEQLMLDVLGEGGTVDELVGRSGATLATVVDALDRLDERGLVDPDGPVWRRRVRSVRR